MGDPVDVVGIDEGRVDIGVSSQNLRLLNRGASLKRQGDGCVPEAVSGKPSVVNPIRLRFSSTIFETERVV